VIFRKNRSIYRPKDSNIRGVADWPHDPVAGNNEFVNRDTRSKKIVEQYL